VIASFMAIAFNIVIITFTIEYFQHLAIALSTSCTMLLNFFFLIIVLHRKLDGFPLKSLLTGVMKIILSTIGLVLLLLLMLPFCEVLLNGNKFYQLVSVLFLIGAAAFFYLLILYLLKLQEATLLVSTIRSKISANTGKR
jgi:putative peptidoglycan lipid II flippase